MRKQYLHLSAYSCDLCAGPVIAGAVAVRENEISKETDIRQVEQSVCPAAIGKAGQPNRRGLVICCRLNGIQRRRAGRVI